MIWHWSKVWRRSSSSRDRRKVLGRRRRRLRGRTYWGQTNTEYSLSSNVEADDLNTANSDGGGCRRTDGRTDGWLRWPQPLWSWCQLLSDYQLTAGTKVWLISRSNSFHETAILDLVVKVLIFSGGCRKRRHWLSFQLCMCHGIIFAQSSGGLHSEWRVCSDSHRTRVWNIFLEN